MTSAFYNNYFEELGKGNINFNANTFYIALVTSTFTLDIDNDVYITDINGEAVGTGYVAGGHQVDSVTLTQDNVNNRAVIDFADETFSTVTLTNVVGYVLYKNTGTPATSPLICYVEFTEGAQSTVANDFIVRPNAAGVMTIG